MEWFYANENDEQIPTTEENLQTLVRQGVIKRDTLVWNESMTNWLACNETRPDLFEATVVNTPPDSAAAIPTTPSQPVAPVQVPGEPPPLVYQKTQGPADGMATTSLVCGIVGLVMSMCYGLGVPVSIVAVVCGHIGRKKLREANFPMENGQLTAGLVLGWIGVGLGLLFLIFMIIYFVFVGVAGAAASEM